MDDGCGCGCLLNLVDIFTSLISGDNGDTSRVDGYFIIVGLLGTLGSLVWYFALRPRLLGNGFWFVLWFSVGFLVIGMVGGLYHRFRG